MAVWGDVRLRILDDVVGAYWPIVGLAHLVTYYRDNQERKLRAAALEKELVQAQLASLKMQLHPHFLFNSLHAVSALMRKDVRAAEEMLASLSELLRMALDHVADQEVSLRSEVELRGATSRSNKPVLRTGSPSSSGSIPGLWMHRCRT